MGTSFDVFARALMPRLKDTSKSTTSVPLCEINADYLVDPISDL